MISIQKAFNSGNCVLCKGVTSGDDGKAFYLLVCFCIMSRGGIALISLN